MSPLQGRNEAWVWWKSVMIEQKKVLRFEKVVVTLQR